MRQVEGESPGHTCGEGVVCLLSTLKTHLNNHDTNWELVGINLDGEGEREGGGKGGGRGGRGKGGCEEGRRGGGKGRRGGGEGEGVGGGGGETRQVDAQMWEVNVSVPVCQSMVGLWRASQGNPRTTWKCASWITSKVMSSECVPWMRRREGK